MNSRGHRRDRIWGDLKPQLLEEWNLLLRLLLQGGWEGGMITGGRGGRGIEVAGVHCWQELVGRIQEWTPGWGANGIRTEDRSH